MSQQKTETAFYITVYLNPDKLQDWFEASKPVFEKVKAENGLVFFEMYQVPDTPGTVCWVEKWSQPLDWLMQNQMNKDYYKDYFSATEAMYTKPREVKVLSPVGPPFCHS
ncbi:hypothetical protein CkaCkLH20_00606 [Colletotrichum karsti]|uniref:ABM domain-containing protein n=1 Tax=Colletotrichum karsti TaxID=1095194 RepID=A0A9P6LPW9_9PEZI|nr:uncharacterized protein CkaCkLH20_00606 [Colletotrichum karsti]KAF9881460.1 hypothetical protein CkaCkLH20_00606 [Colletotrichum karsti]